MKPWAISSFLVLFLIGLVGFSAAAGPQVGALMVQPAAEHAATMDRTAPNTPSLSQPSPQPTGTPEVQRKRLRPYPAPTGLPAFRRYYQIRCYPGCHYGATPSAQSVTVTPPVPVRVHRSYPAPTGAPGFRRYYQIRCYPGCHTYDSPAPAATQVHP